MKPAYVLDACSLIAFFRDEKGADVVDTLLQQAGAKQVALYLHKVTMVEVLYDRMRTEKSSIQQLIADISRLPITVTEQLDNEFVGKAATYKASHKISFADSFVLALAESHNATVVTSDRHEFGPVEKSGILSFSWIR